MSIKPRSMPGRIPAKKSLGIETSLTKANIIIKFEGGIILPSAPAAAAIPPANPEL